MEWTRVRRRMNLQAVNHSRWYQCRHLLSKITTTMTRRKSKSPIHKSRPISESSRKAWNCSCWRTSRKRLLVLLLFRLFSLHWWRSHHIFRTFTSILTSSPWVRLWWTVWAVVFLCYHLGGVVSIIRLWWTRFKEWTWSLRLLKSSLLILTTPLPWRLTKEFFLPLLQKWSDERKKNNSSEPSVMSRWEWNRRSPGRSQICSCSSKLWLVVSLWQSNPNCPSHLSQTNGTVAKCVRSCYPPKNRWSGCSKRTRSYGAKTMLGDSEWKDGMESTWRAAWKSFSFGWPIFQRQHQTGYTLPTTWVRSDCWQIRTGAFIAKKERCQCFGRQTRNWKSRRLGTWVECLLLWQMTKHQRRLDWTRVRGAKTRRGWRWRRMAKWSVWTWCCKESNAESWMTVSQVRWNLWSTWSSSRPRYSCLHGARRWRLWWRQAFMWTISTTWHRHGSP